MNPMFMTPGLGSLAGGNRSASIEKVAGPLPAPPTPPIRRTTSSALAVATTALPMLAASRDEQADADDERAAVSSTSG